MFHARKFPFQGRGLLCTFCARQLPPSHFGSCIASLHYLLETTSGNHKSHTVVIPFDIINEDGYLGMTFMFLANTIKIFAFGWVVCAKGNFAIFMNDKVYQDYDYLTGKFGKIVLSGES